MGVVNPGHGQIGLFDGTNVTPDALHAASQTTTAPVAGLIHKSDMIVTFSAPPKWTCAVDRNITANEMKEDIFNHLYWKLYHNTLHPQLDNNTADHSFDPFVHGDSECEIKRRADIWEEKGKVQI